MPMEPRETHPSDVRMRGFATRADVEDVVRAVRERTAPLEGETVALSEAAGRVLAEEVSSPVAVPGFDRAMMDGYAVRGEETFGATPYDPRRFRVIGEALPGHPFAGEITRGTAVRIMTGAAMPRGGDAVAPAEVAREVDGGAGGPRLVDVTEAVPPVRHVGPAGEDIREGEVLFGPGRRLRPQDIGVLASIGRDGACVVRRPRVALIATGDELVPCGERPSGARIVDSNSPMLAAFVRRDGGVPREIGIVRDRREAVAAALLDAAATSDLVLVSGGSSVGTEDHAPGVLAERGRLLVHGIAMRPSSPTGLGILEGRLVFLLPGNPVSCLCAYDFFAGPAVRRLGGRADAWPYRSVRRTLRRKIASALGRVDYVRVRVAGMEAEPLAVSGASVLTSTTRGDGFVVVPRDSEGHAVGAEVEVWLYDEAGAWEA